MPISDAARREARRRAAAEQRDMEHATKRKYQRRTVTSRRGTVARRYVVMDGTRAWPAKRIEAMAAAKRGRPVRDFISGPQAADTVRRINKHRAAGRDKTPPTWSGDNLRQRKSHHRKEVKEWFNMGMKVPF